MKSQCHSLGKKTCFLIKGLNFIFPFIDTSIKVTSSTTTVPTDTETKPSGMPDGEVDNTATVNFANTLEDNTASSTTPNNTTSSTTPENTATSAISANRNTGG